MDSLFLTILPLKDLLRRDFYAEMCRIERWSVRTLRNKIGGMLFERTALSKKPEMFLPRSAVRSSETSSARGSGTQTGAFQGRR